MKVLVAVKRAIDPNVKVGVKVTSRYRREWPANCLYPFVSSHANALLSRVVQ